MIENAAPHSRMLSSAVKSENLRWAVVVGLGAGLLWFSLPAIISLHKVWQDDLNYSHGYLVVCVTVILVVLEARRAPLGPWVPAWTGLTCFLLLALAMVVGRAATMSHLSYAALPAFWIAALWAIAGRPIASRFVSPLAYLYFAVPLWDYLLKPLQSLTILVVSQWIRAAGVPAFIEGNLIHIPSGTFEVLEGCAGLRYAIVAMALGAAGGLLHYRRWAAPALLTVSAFALALCANWLRIFVITVVGYVSEMRSPLVVEGHSFFGWALFLVCMAPLYYLDRALQGRSAMAIGVERGPNVSQPVPWRDPIVYAVLTALGAGIWFNHLVGEGVEAPQAQMSLEMPQVSGWNRATQWQAPTRPYFFGSEIEGARWYQKDGIRVGAYVAAYVAQRQGSEIVSAANQPEGLSSKATERRIVTTTADSGATMSWQELEVSDSDGTRRVVWVGLRVAGRSVSSQLQAKIWQVAGVIFGRQDAQGVVLTALCDPDCDVAHSWLSNYARVGAETLYQTAEKSLGLVPQIAESSGL